jgi:Tol biopolymer transport system component
MHQLQGISVPCRSFVGVLLALVTMLPAPAHGQYFGRNKVEYKDFDFGILRTEHFDVYYYEREERAARIAARLAERWYARISRVLDHRLEQRQPLVIYASQADFAQTNVISGLLPDSVGGVTESTRRRIVMPFAPTMAETDRVLGHELVHAFQFDIGRRYGGTGQPLWFIEGMAEYLARGSADAESELWLRDAVRSDRVPAKQSETAQRLSPYQYGHAFWSYLGNRFGDGVIEKAMKPDKKHRRLADRMRYATGVDLDTLHADWRTSVYRSHTPASGTDRVELWSRDGMQVAPSLSPDGRRAVFFSERDRLSIDLFLADVKSGRVVRKLATTAASARFDSLQPLRSAGAWSPEGDWFAFPAVRHGRATLTLVPMRGGQRERELVFERLGHILTVSWSPDGRSMAFSAAANGFTDLYLLDLSTNTLRQLTDDAPADLQPAWSHDGRTIAFVTERYSSDLAALRFGRPQLALLDVETEVVHQVDVGDSRAQLSPGWSAGDDSLYFVGDADGITNVFRVALGSRGELPSTAPNTLEQLTSVPTGVSGLTPTSPALSVAGGSPVVAYTVYERGRPQLVVFDASTASARGAVSAPDPAPAVPALDTATALAEEAVIPGLVDRLRADQQTGLPDPSRLDKGQYSSRLSLEAIGQPYMSSGGGPFGTFVRGGGAVMFGDMLGERRLGAAVQIGNRLRDAAFEFRFLNQERRWNWGMVAELEPGLRRYRRNGAIEYDGQSALLKQAEYLQRTQLRTAALVAYPFNRGLRLELTGGVRHAMYRRELRSQISSAATGRVLATDEVALSGGAPTTVAEVGAALVHDTTVFGATGPLLGSRYRFEIAPAIGELSYTRLVADYRRYLMPVRPYSVAVRVLHSARYGPDGDDPRLMSSFLGSNYFVRGHRLDLRQCPPDATRVCGDELLGSRLLVANVEIRVPVWGIFSRRLDYGRLPADAFVFADGGLVWSGRRPLDSGRVSRATGISSIGAGIRLNAGGLPFEFASTRALDGPRPGWQWDFGFRVGF